MSAIQGKAHELAGQHVKSLYEIRMELQPQICQFELNHATDSGYLKPAQGIVQLLRLGQTQNKSVKFPVVLLGHAATGSGRHSFFFPKISATQILISYIRYMGIMITNMVIRSAWKAATMELARRAYLRLVARNL